MAVNSAPEGQGPGLIPYHLADYFCEECGQPKLLRMSRSLSGCTLCDAVRTAHRCTGRPLAFERDEGDEWTCPECGAVYRVTVEIEEVRHSSWEVATPPTREVPPRLPSGCYWLGASRVHVKPGCRCGDDRLIRWGRR